MSGPASTSNNPGPAVTTGNDYLGGGTPFMVGLEASDLVGFYGAPGVTQPNGTGNTNTVAAGATTAVYTNTTFDGSTGSTAYTVGDIVQALKALGILQS